MAGKDINMAITTLPELKEQARRAGFDPKKVKSFKPYFSLIHGGYACRWHEGENRKLVKSEHTHIHKIVKAIRIKAPGTLMNGLALMLDRSGYTPGMLLKRVYWRFGCNPKNIILPEKEERTGVKQ